MNRRNFLSLLFAGVAGIALEQAIPFNRVWSFPKRVLPCNFLPTEWVTMESLALLKEQFRFIEVAARKFDQQLVQVKISSYRDFYSESSPNIARALREYRRTVGKLAVST